MSRLRPAVAVYLIAMLIYTKYNRHNTPIAKNKNAIQFIILVGNMTSHLFASLYGLPSYPVSMFFFNAVKQLVLYQRAYTGLKDSKNNRKAQEKPRDNKKAGSRSSR